MKARLLLAVACTALCNLAVAQNRHFTDWPAGTDPREVGKRVAEAFIPVPNSMAYNMAKAATDHMARTAATELLEHRVRVNIVHPGWVDTPGERKFASEEDIAVRGSKLPWGRLATPEEIARGVVFLADPASEYMTGSALLIDGGNTLPWWARSGMAVPP